MYVSVLDSCAILFRRPNQLLSLLLAVVSTATAHKRARNIINVGTLSVV